MKRALLLVFSLLMSISIVQAQVQLAILSASDWVQDGGFGTSVSMVGNTAAVAAHPFRGVGATYVFVKPASGWHDMTETAKLTLTDGASPDSAAIFNDTVVVEASGATYIFVKPAGGWTNMTETAKLTTSDGAQASVVSIFGDTVAVAASGATYIFVKPATGWQNMTQTAKLTASNGANPNSVSIFGNTVAFGASGAAYVFVRPATGWQDMIQTARLTSTDQESTLALSVATNGDTILVGGSYCFGSFCPEASQVFVRPASGWKDMTETAALSLQFYGSPDGPDGFGDSGAVNVNGEVVAVGVPSYRYTIDGAGPGAVFLFAKGKGWHSRRPFAELTPSDAQFLSNRFGTSLAVSGQFGIVGGPNSDGGDFNSHKGEAYVFGPAS